MSEIYVKENESLDNALKRFKRSCAKSGVLADLRKKEFYQSPSVKAQESEAAPRKRTRTSASIDEKEVFRRRTSFFAAAPAALKRRRDTV